jgi:hypothetical protein
MLNRNIIKRVYFYSCINLRPVVFFVNPKYVKNKLYKNKLELAIESAKPKAQKHVNYIPYIYIIISKEVCPSKKFFLKSD